MIMKKSVATLLSAMTALSVLATGCHTMTSQQIADTATQQLGLPVFLWAFGNDQCSSRQLSLLFNEYNSYNSGRRAAIAKRLNTTYTALIVMETQNYGEINGSLKTLQLWNSGRYVIASKTLLDTRTNITHMMAGTRVDKGNASDIEGKVLTVQPTYAEDHALKPVYYTYDRATFDALRADNWELDTVVNIGKVHLNSQGHPSDDVCGQLVHISDLF